MNTIIFILVLIVAYYFLNLYVVSKIDKAIYLDEKRRKLHKNFIWLVPFLGPLIIRGFWKTRKNEKLEVMTKDKRKIDKSNFYESGKGIHGY